MNEKLIKDIQWLDKILVEFDSAVESYRDDFNKKIRPSMMINQIQEGEYSIDFLNINLIVKLENVLDEAKIKTDNINNKVCEYINNLMFININKLKNKCI
ncbi:hypothetical protein DWV12_07570 [Clostridium botulinum]|uniref:hypothetical protein n=1 Tax=Clostridium botulinum TaxID=1491 RepID=UPI00217CE3E3|nr:hypothetical protein [Clostridium botulinum]MCS6103587.1 hypothetical protein [Clostridium botulinum]MCS6107255.1 hypothetical protein [Clostridium botulinum]